MKAGIWEPPVSAIDTLADDLAAAGLAAGPPPQDLDPLAAGILMDHQLDWVEDKADLKLCEKGRRTGITFAEALDDVTIAAAARSAGGDDVWYIGDTKDKGREFVETCARFAKHVAKELLTVEEFLFEDVQADGSSRDIQAWRIVFASGYRISALSSNPASIRGLQGVVVIDEAAFHRNVNAVIDACKALLIWGGRIRIISTHNRAKNAFNVLVQECRAGKFPFSLHHVTFDDAVANGLYERVCLMRGWTPSIDGKRSWYGKVRGSYGTRTAVMREELDAIARESEGRALSIVVIEACMRDGYSVLRWTPPKDDFVDWPEEARRLVVQAWLELKVGPLLKALPGRRTFFGQDFAMKRDRSVMAFGYTAENLDRHVPLILELARCPYDQQKQVLFWCVSRLRGFGGGIMDANGSGAALAQEARQRFGGERIVELMVNDGWYREHVPPFIDAFEGQEIVFPRDAAVRDDLGELASIDGVIKIPRAARRPVEGEEDGKRHGDAAIALLNFYTASRSDFPEIAFSSTGETRAGYQGFIETADARPEQFSDRGFGAVRGQNDFTGY